MAFFCKPGIDFKAFRAYSLKQIRRGGALLASLNTRAGHARAPERVRLKKLFHRTANFATLKRLFLPGRLKGDCIMANDEGVYTKTFTNGSKQFEVSYARGKLNGVMRRWAQNGTLILERNYVDDVLEGRSKRWYESGILQEDAFYIDDKLEGEYVQYDKSGNVAMRARFRDGKIDETSIKVQ